MLPVVLQRLSKGNASVTNWGSIGDFFGSGNSSVLSLLRRCNTAAQDDGLGWLVN